MFNTAIQVKVTIPLWYTGEEGWYDSQPLGGGHVPLYPERQSANHLFVAQFLEGTPEEDIQRLCSEGMQRCHQEVQQSLEERYGDRWWSRGISYTFGNFEHHREEVRISDPHAISGYQLSDREQSMLLTLSRHYRTAANADQAAVLNALVDKGIAERCDSRQRIDDWTWSPSFNEWLHDKFPIWRLRK